MRRETYQDGVLVEVEDLPDAIPEVVTARQLKRALYDAGLYDQVSAFVATLPRPTFIDWEYATEFRRDHPVLVAGAAALQMTPEQIDALFTAAAGIE